MIDAEPGGLGHLGIAFDDNIAVMPLLPPDRCIRRKCVIKAQREMGAQLLSAQGRNAVGGRLARGMDGHELVDRHGFAHDRLEHLPLCQPGGTPFGGIGTRRDRGQQCRCKADMYAAMDCAHLEIKIIIAGV